jgi:hypothetical protein
LPAIERAPRAAAHLKSTPEEPYVRHVSEAIIASPCCICRGADGTIYWATWCPRCEKDDVESAIAGNHRTESAECSVCGTTIAVDVAQGLRG